MSKPSFPLIALGASVGGLHALKTILEGLPADFPAAITIVQHISPDHPSHLAEILNRATALSVKEAQEGDKLQLHHAYIAASGYHLVVNSNQTLSLSDSPRVHFSRPSVDVLFKSVANVYQHLAIAVVLTGYDSDGSDGVQLIKQNGGIVITQDLDSSKAIGMPKAAIATGIVDFILPLEKIAFNLVQIVTSLNPL